MIRLAHFRIGQLIDLVLEWNIIRFSLQSGQTSSTTGYSSQSVHNISIHYKYHVTHMLYTQYLPAATVPNPDLHV